MVQITVSSAKSTVVEPPLSEIISKSLFHLWFTGLCTTSHQVAYFMLGITFWAIHFAHYFFVFITLLLFCLYKRENFQLLPLKDIFPVCATQCLVTVFTCLIHDVGSNSALYAQRFTDGIVIVLVCLLAKFFIPPNLSILPQHKYLLIAFGVISSFGWCESLLFSFRWSYLYLLPLLDICTAIHLLLTLQKFRKLNVSLNTYLLNICGLTSLFLLPLALLFTTDSVSKEWYNEKRVWETSDIGVLFMSYIGYTVMIYTKYWLICKCTQESYLFVRQVKYHFANYGQLFFRNFTVTPLSVIARPVGTLLMLLYVRKRLAAQKQNSVTSGSIVSNEV